MNAAQLAALSQHFASLTGLFVEKPRMSQPIQEYTRRYWASHIRPIFIAEWEEKCAQLMAQGKELPTKVGVAERNAVVRRCWAEESKELQDEIKADLEAEHKQALLEYKQKMTDIPNAGRTYTW